PHSHQARHRHIRRGRGMTHRMSVPAWVRTAALAVIAAVALAGCSGSSEPDPTPTAAAPTTAVAGPTDTEAAETASPTAEPGEASGVPPLPDAAKENTPEGAEAFIRYYFDVTNAAYTTPEAGLLPSLSDPECLACKAIEEQNEGLVQQDIRVKIAPFELTEMQRVGGSAPDVTSFNVKLSQPAYQVLDS